MQAPAAPDEDTRGGFARGGWGRPYQDKVMAAEMARSMARGGALLLGRRTYEHFYRVWPNRRNNPYTEVLNNTQKYVASRKLKGPLPWMNSTLLKGDAVAAVRKLKKQKGKDLVILGSGDLVASLMPHGLIDSYLLSIYPVVVGSGRRLFSKGDVAKLKLVHSVPTSKGVLIATYEPA
jgi:dihydrofolate reductase